MFVETWLAAHGYDVQSKEVSYWRRDEMSDLTGAFDFDHVRSLLLSRIAVVLSY